MIRSNIECQFRILTRDKTTHMIICKESNWLFICNLIIGITIRSDCCQFIIHRQIFKILPSIFGKYFSVRIMTTEVTLTFNQWNIIMPRLCNIYNCIFNCDRGITDNNSSTVIRIILITTEYHSIVTRISCEVVYRNFIMIQDSRNITYCDIIDLRIHCISNV